MLLINYFEVFSYISIGIFLIFTILFIFLYEWRSPNHRRRCRQLPGPKLKPIVGFGFDAAGLKNSELLDFGEKLINKYGSLVYIEMFGLPYVISTDPEDVEKILSSSQHNMTKGTEYQSLVYYLGEGLVTSSGDKWHNRRKKLTPTFHFKILENYVSVFNRNAHLLTEKFLQTSGQPCGDVDLYVSLCVLDIICETVMGTRLDSQMGNAQKYVAAVQRIGEIVCQRTLSFWWYRDWVFFSSPTGRESVKIVKSIHQFIDKIIKERKQMNNFNHLTASETGKYKNRKSFLDNLIEMQKEHPDIMTDVGIREEVNTFMFVGTDSTSVANTWILYLLAKHPDVQERVREEIWSVFGESDEREATMEDVQELRYLDMVIKECLRLYPTVPYLSRFMTSDLHLKKYTIPAKTNVAILPYLMHRNPEYFPDPEKFDPDRFLPESVKNRHPFAYIPFSAGFRNCIGQKFAMIEMKIIISTILRKLIVKEGPIKQEIKAMPQIVLNPHPKIILSFTPLQSNSL